MKSAMHRWKMRNALTGEAGPDIRSPDVTATLRGLEDHVGVGDGVARADQADVAGPAKLELGMRLIGYRRVAQRRTERRNAVRIAIEEIAGHPKRAHLEVRQDRPEHV